MKKCLIIVLGILLAVACAPMDPPTLPSTPSVEGNESSDNTGNDSSNEEGDSTPDLPDESVDLDPTGLSSMDISFNSEDETSYGEVIEMVITDENHDDFGDFIENYTPKNTVVITYKEGKATYTGKPSGVNVMVSGNHVVVTSSKKDIAYTLKGTTTDGSFKLYSDKKALITFDGVSITNPTGAAINVQSGKTMMVKIADGTANYLEDGTEYELTDGEQQKGAFFSEGQLVFSGEGALAVKSNYGHGIASDDYVRVRDGNISINSTRDGISTKDRFVMYGGTLDIQAKQDGVDVGEGYIEIGGGKLKIQAVDEGLAASYEGDDDGYIDPLITPYIDIRGGFIKVETTGDKGHGLRAMSTFSMSGGSVVQVATSGAGSKALLSEGKMSLVKSKITAITEGDALYESDVNELSSSAAIRSKGELVMDEMVVGVKSTGKGSKGINNVGDITLDNSNVRVVATGADYSQDGDTSHSYGVNTDGTLSVNGGKLLIKTTHAPIKASSEQFSGDATYEFVTVGN